MPRTFPVDCAFGAARGIFDTCPLPDQPRHATLALPSIVFPTVMIKPLSAVDFFNLHQFPRKKLLYSRLYLTL